MRPQLDVKNSGNKTPGANNYKLPRLMGGKISMSGTKGKFGSSSEWSMTGRSDIGSFANTRFRAPGPGKYAPEDTTTKNTVKAAAPAYTMRARTYQPLSGTKTPGPKYDVRGKGGQKGSTFGVKHSPYAYIVCE
jgi:hypothetical protein